MTNIIIVDDHQILRQGLELIFETVADFTVVGTAADGQAGLDLIETTHPDIVLTDIRMAGMDGITMMRNLHASHPELPVVVLTTFDDQEPIQQAIQLGAKGFLLKDTSASDIVSTLRNALAGQVTIEPRLALKALAAQNAPKISLTPREHEILTQVAQGFHSKDIAANLHLSERTIKSHLTNIYNTLGVFTRAEAVAKALQTGLISLD